MSNIESKIGEGLSSLQGGLEQSKVKLQIVQELNRLKKTMRESSEEKAKIIYELGELCHQWIREKKIDAPDFLKISDKIVEKDRLVFEISNKILELTPDHSRELICKCGAKLEQDDKFCGECGVINENKEIKESLNWKVCHVCQSETPEESDFCRCCGNTFISL